MVSKEQYYARKAAGLCTKCGKSREGSPSQARCLDCHNKLKTKTSQSAESEVFEEKLPSISKKAESLKQNTVIEKTADQKICQRCGETPLSFNLICQKCLKSTVFTKAEAIARFENKCSLCSFDNIKGLKIVSSDISKPMKHKDQELYKVICYRRILPQEYRVLCHICYWKENLAYVKQMKQIFDTNGIFEESFIDDDILDV